MRCSLLTLSSYLDRELPPDRAGELEAHLIACPRCSTGLGYLREEAERIRGLSAARVPVHAAEQLLVTVGLAEQRAPVGAPMRYDDEPPIPQVATPAPAAGMPGEYEPRFDFSPGLIGSAYGPDTAQPVAPGIDDYVETPDVATHEPDLIDAVDEEVAVPVTDEPVEHDEPAYHDEAAHHDAAHDVVEVAGTAQRMASRNYWGGSLAPPEASPPEASPPDVALPEPEPPELVPSEPIAAEMAQTEMAPLDMEPLDVAAAVPVPPDVAMPPSPPPVAVPHGARGAGMFDRIRDAIALRLALMRSSHVDELDDSVQIVSGAGAPDWTAHPSQRDRHERMAAAYGMPAELDAFHDIAMSRDIPMAHDMAIPPDTAIQPLDIETVEDLPPVPMHPDPIEPEPEVAGRHTRALQHARASMRGWPGLGSLRSRAPRMPRTRGPARSALADPRVGAFGAAVLVLLVIGLLIGKHSTPLLPGNTARAIPNPTAIANVPPNVVATPAVTPTTAPTPTPAPTPSPLQLTDVKTLGSGASGFVIQGLRYGNHPGDFRIVFDLAGASANAPKVVAGFGSPTTLYVEFAGASAAGPPKTPPKGSVVTAITVLDPSPIPGRTVYELTLSRSVHLSAIYLTSPFRLVLDLS